MHGDYQPLPGTPGGNLAVQTSAALGSRQCYFTPSVGDEPEVQRSEAVPLASDNGASVRGRRVILAVLHL